MLILKQMREAQERHGEERRGSGDEEEDRKAVRGGGEEEVPEQLHTVEDNESCPSSPQAPLAPFPPSHPHPNPHSLALSLTPSPRPSAIATRSDSSRSSLFDVVDPSLSSSLRPSSLPLGAASDSKRHVPPPNPNASSLPLSLQVNPCVLIPALCGSHSRKRSIRLPHAPLPTPQPACSLSPSLPCRCFNRLSRSYPSDTVSSPPLLPSTSPLHPVILASPTLPISDLRPSLSHPFFSRLL